MLHGIVKKAFKMLVSTLGDPFSINCEALANVLLPRATRLPVLLIGSRWQFDFQCAELKVKSSYAMVDDERGVKGAGIYLLDPAPTIGNKRPQELSDQERGQLMVAALRAVPKRYEGRMAVLTCPINKRLASTAGFQFPGQTEFFEDHWRSSAVMLLAGPRLRVALITNHLALRDVPGSLSVEGIARKLSILSEGVKQLFGIHEPKIGVCALNPHAGDGGLFGDEEGRLIGPAIEKARGICKAKISQPLPADTAFHRAIKGEFDVVVAMYHDQGLGPLKTVHFYDSVNVSLGLPYLRVSPDHGPATDLYRSGTANFDSFEQAAALCEAWLGDHHIGGASQ